MGLGDGAVVAGAAVGDGEGDARAADGGLSTRNVGRKSRSNWALYMDTNWRCLWLFNDVCGAKNLRHTRSKVVFNESGGAVVPSAPAGTGSEKHFISSACTADSSSSSGSGLNRTITSSSMASISDASAGCWRRRNAMSSSAACTEPRWGCGGPGAGPMPGWGGRGGMPGCGCGGTPGLDAGPRGGCGCMGGPRGGGR